MNRRNPLIFPLRYAAGMLLLAVVSGTAPLHATPFGEGSSSCVLADSTGFNDTTPRPIRKRDSHLVSRDRSSHSFFVNAGVAGSSIINFKESTSGSLNKGFGINAGYSWLSRKGIGVGVVYAGNFFSAERNERQREACFHYVGVEFVARQRVGRRWLFRESTGLGFGMYTRTYGQQTDTNCGIGEYFNLSVQYMLTKHLGLGLNMSGQWLITKKPDIDDGFDLNLLGTMLVNCGGGVYLYF